MDKITVLMVTIPSRKDAMRKVVDSLYGQVDELRIVFNDYEKIPDWVQEKSKTVGLLNTPDKYTSNAIWLLIDEVDGFVFTCDDDILYPANYVEEMIKTLQEYKKNAVISMYGETVRRPPTNYLKGRRAIGFCDALDQNKIVDIIGTGCALFHTDAIKPNVNDFPDVYSRDLWFSIYIHKMGVPIVRKQSGKNWLHHCDSPGPEIKKIWRSNPKLSKRREEVFTKILVPLLLKRK